MNAAPLDIECDILNQAGQWSNLPQISDIIDLTISYAQKKSQPIHKDIHSLEISVVLSNNDHVQELNRDYRSKDKPTNVLSFPQDEPSLLGDIIIAKETIEKESIEQNKSFNNHFTHMLVHGCLHLLGFDHIDDEEAQIMENLEIQILSELNIKNPYENDHF